MFKEGKYRIIIDNVYCVKAKWESSSSAGSMGKIQPFEGDDCPPSETPMIAGPSCKRQKELM